MARRITTLVFVGTLSAAPLALGGEAPPAAAAAFERGEKALAANQLDRAVTAYREAIAAAPTWAPPLNGLGNVLFKQNKREEALVQFRAAVAADPTMKLAWFNLGYAARKSGDFESAAAAYEKYVQLEPNDPDGYYGLAESRRGLNDTAKAIAAYESFLQKEKRPSEQKWIDKAKEAIAALKLRAAESAQSGTPAVVTPTAPPAEVTNTSGGAKVHLIAGDKAWAQKSFREAAAHYAEAVNAAPDSVEALFKLGNSHAVLGAYEEAIRLWTKVSERAPDGETKKRAVENIAKAQQKLSLASANPGAGPTPSPAPESPRRSARTHYEAGVQHVLQRDYAAALTALTQALELEPTLAIGYIARGSALVGLQRYDDAALDYQYALKLDAALSAPLFGLAEAYRGLNRPAEAKRYYQQYLSSTAPDARTDLKSHAQIQLGKLP